MYPFLAAVLVAVTPVYYEAQVQTFGCNSSQEVTDLLSIRDNKDEFERQLMSQIVYGQCVGIAQGTVVDGSVESTDPTIVRVDRESNPPGYMAPLSDFKLKEAQGEEEQGKAGEEKP